MSKSPPSTNFVDLTKSFALQGKITQDLQALATIDVGAARQLIDRLAALLGPANSPVMRVPVSKALSVYDRVAEAFVERGNQPLTKSALHELTGVPEGSLHSLIYTGRKDRFERLKNPAGGKEKVVRLTNQAYTEAIGASVPS